MCLLVKKKDGEESVEECRVHRGHIYTKLRNLMIHCHRGRGIQTKSGDWKSLGDRRFPLSFTGVTLPVEVIQLIIGLGSEPRSLAIDLKSSFCWRFYSLVPREKSIMSMQGKAAENVHS